MDTNNLDKWWHGLPEKHQTGYRRRWDMGKTGYAIPFGATPGIPCLEFTERQKTGMRNARCSMKSRDGLGDLALVRKNGIALEEMCNGNGEFYDEYQEQFNILYDNYGHIIENISWPDWIGHTIPTNRELVRLLEHHGYKRMEIDTDRRIPKNFLCFPSWVAHQRKRGLVLPHHTATGQFRTGAFCGMRNQRR